MPGLDGPPPLPVDVKSQMGASPFAGVGDMMMSKAGATDAGAAPGGADPQGALKAQVGAIKSVLQKVVEMAGPGKTFFSRALQMIEQGLAVEGSKGPGTPNMGQGADQPPTSGQAGGMTAPPPAFPG
jgi:hypothetical protein